MKMNESFSDFAMWTVTLFARIFVCCAALKYIAS